MSVSGATLTVTGPNASLSKQFNASSMSVQVSQDEVKVAPIGKLSRKKSAAVNAIKSHLKNMVEGVVAGFSTKLSVVYAHFPISIEVKGKQVLIKNFLGEKSPRSAEIVGDTQVKADKQELAVSGSDKESVGQTAANIVQATRVRNRDIRVFQDGIYKAVEQ